MGAFDIFETISLSKVDTELSEVDEQSPPLSEEPICDFERESGFNSFGGWCVVA
jgi:hypothetical protein